MKEPESATLDMPPAEVLVPREGTALPSASIGELDFASRASDRVTSGQIAMGGLFGFGLAWLIAYHWKCSVSSLIVLFVGFTAAPMMLLNIVANRTHLRNTSGLGATIAAMDGRRCMLKCLGLCATLLSLGAAYWIIPEYHRQFYQPCWEAAIVAGPLMLALSFGYIAWVDRRMIEPEDDYYQAGLLVLGRRREMRRGWAKGYFLTWTIKGFFLPLMIAGSARHLTLLAKDGVNFGSFDTLFTSSINLLFSIDVIFGAIGYLLTLRVLDAQIRTTETTGLGWVSAIMCYVPFSTALWPAYFELPGIAGSQTWRHCLNGSPILYITWGFIVILLYGLYTWSTCTFGCRFSNLTNRGILNTGLYRYIKHPAYVAKNLAWWAMYLPFFAHETLGDNIRATALLAMSTGIYALRAWTEERHLMKDPAYFAYSACIDEDGLWANAKRSIRRILRVRQ